MCSNLYFSTQVHSHEDPLKSAEVESHHGFESEMLQSRTKVKVHWRGASNTLHRLHPLRLLQPLASKRRHGRVAFMNPEPLCLSSSVPQRRTPPRSSKPWEPQLATDSLISLAEGVKTWSCFYLLPVMVLLWQNNTWGNRVETPMEGESK